MPLSITSLLASNLFTAYLAITQHWNLASLMLVYWFQSVVIGMFQFLKILDLKEFSTENFTINDRAVEPTQATKIQTAIFFLFHYGFFHFVYLIFISAGVVGDKPFFMGGLWLPAALYLVNHSISFFANRKQNQQRVPNIGQMMFYPYARIIPMHLTIIFGSALQLPIVLFLGLKTLADLIMHLQEHTGGKKLPFSTGIGGN